jgi:HEAT repeat protein
MPELIEKIKDSTIPLQHTLLSELSNLAEDKLTVFRDTWSLIDTIRRQSILTNLTSMAENNVQMNFTSIFNLGLHDIDDTAKTIAISGLWECENKVFMMRLLELLETDHSPKVRAAAATGLGRFTSLAAEGKLKQQESSRIKQTLIKIVEATSLDVEIRRRALESLGCLADPKVIQLIKKSYESPESPMRHSAIFAMGKNCEPQWLSTVTTELNSSDPAMKYEAICACKEIGDESTVTRITPLLDDKDPQIQFSAIEALGAIGGELANKELLKRLKHGTHSIQAFIKQVLEENDFDSDPFSFNQRA